MALAIKIEDHPEEGAVALRRPTLLKPAVREKLQNLDAQQFIDDAEYLDVCHEFRSHKLTEKVFAVVSARHFHDKSRRALEQAQAWTQLY